MAHKHIGYFDSRGHYFKSPEEATISDLAMLLGRIGEGDSLAPGIASMLLDRRVDLERIFAEHDQLKIDETEARSQSFNRAGNVTPLPSKANSATG